MKKINIIVCSLLISIVLFLILTVIQKKMISYEPKVSVLIAGQNIEPNEKLEDNMFREALAPISVIKESSVITKISENMYAREKIHNGQIIFIEDVGSREELKILNNESGCERVSIKLKGPENAISYQIKPGDKINVYFTGKYISVIDLGTFDSNVTEGKMYTSKIISDKEILGIFDSNGVSYNDESFLKPDTIVLSVPYEIATKINNLRNQGTFDITA